MKWPQILQIKPRIHLVMGISSCGKSTYIHSATDYSQRNLPIYLANDLARGDADEMLGTECVVHYNLFRVYDNNAGNLHRDIAEDAVLRLLLARARELDVTFLVTSREQVARRMLLRTTGEELLRGHTVEDYKYPKFDLLELLYRIDLQGEISRWMELLGSHRVNVRYLDASDKEYRQLHSREDVLSILDNVSKHDYSLEQMRAILDEGRFEYQAIQVTPGLRTAGHDRSKTFEAITEHVSFAGKSLLDVGCAYGFFCYQALDAGASRVMGTELKSHRFVGAHIIRGFMSKDCEIRFEDIFQSDFQDNFDIILFLNVIHHLDNPIHALRKLASLCTDTLVIEFPTLADNKFRATLPGDSYPPIDLPLIGVSQFEEQDQYFVFNNAAIERILLENTTTPFGSVQFVPSPMSDERILAICRK